MRPRWGQVRAFCIAQRYRETRTDHYFYDKVLSDGSSSGTKVSFGSDVLHYSEKQISAISREEAQDLLNAHYSGTPRRPPE